MAAILNSNMATILDSNISNTQDLKIKCLKCLKCLSCLKTLCLDTTVRIKKKVLHIQRPIVLKSIDLKICVWHISEEQLILFPLIPFLHQVCHA